MARHLRRRGEDSPHSIRGEVYGDVVQDQEDFQE